MLNVACSPLAVFVMVAFWPGALMITPPLPCSIVLPLISIYTGNAQWPGYWATTSGAAPFSDRAEAIGAANTSAIRMATSVNKMRFKTIPPSPATLLLSFGSRPVPTGTRLGAGVMRALCGSARGLSTSTYPRSKHKGAADGLGASGGLKALGRRVLRPPPS